MIANERLWNGTHNLNIPYILWIRDLRLTFFDVEEVNTEQQNTKYLSSNYNEQATHIRRKVCS